MDRAHVKQLDRALGRLWASHIERFTVDAWRCRISMDLVLKEFGKDTPFELAFSRVSGFSFLHNAENFVKAGQDVERFDFFEEDEVDPSDYTELTSIHYAKPSSFEVTWRRLTGNNPPPISFHPNFVLEMWSSLLLIEAIYVTIDEETFDVGRSDV